MKILNPSYDTIFKYLLEDLEISKGLISRILDKEIIDIKTPYHNMLLLKRFFSCLGFPRTCKKISANSTSYYATGQLPPEFLTKYWIITLSKNLYPPNFSTKSCVYRYPKIVPQTASYGAQPRFHPPKMDKSAKVGRYLY